MRNQVKIIEYDKSYAAAVADMWTRSGDSWGGYNVEVSPEEVTKTEESSTHLKLYLATIEDEVVGYCKLSIDHDDEGALYIDLLSVRPDLHGKKIGKMLVLEAVKETISRKWPRLDLYTWTGNVKAVPLYKKCGFFWEDRDDRTHLINLIPTVLNTELVKDFFETACWYSDSTRPIEQKPDGRKENEFDIFTYSWEKDGKSLLMEFSRRGRGLRKVETDDYSITAIVEDLNLVFGKNYKIRYEIVNKSGITLEVEIKGEDNKNIGFNYEQSVVVDDKIILDSTFYLNGIDRDQAEWKTHPVVKSTIKVNGKTAQFNVGIKPEFPISADIKIPQTISIPDLQSKAFIDLENHYNEKVKFKFSLPKTNDIKFTPDNFEVEMNPKERISLPIRYLLTKSCGYVKNIHFEAIFRSGDQFQFSREVAVTLPTPYGKYFSDSSKKYIIGNGSFLLNLGKLYLNRSYHGNLMKDDHFVYSQPPKLGKPFNGEFEKRECEKVEYLEDNQSITMIAHHSSKEFDGVKLRKYQKLYNNGMVERWFEIENCGDDREREIYLSDGMYLNILDGVLPYRGKIVSTRDDSSNDLDYWRDEDFSENWFFSRLKSGTFGVVWPKDYKLQFSSGAFTFEHNFGKLRSGEISSTKPITTIIDHFQDWREVREFALQKESGYTPVESSFEFIVNGRNPFIKDRFQSKIFENRGKNIVGDLSLTSSSDKGLDLNQSFNDSDRCREYIFEKDLNPEIEILTLSAELNVESLEFDRALFPVKRGEVKQYNETLDGKEIYAVDNGVIKIKLSPEYAPTLFSLYYNGREWLDHSFPKPTAKSWWSPWCGGVMTFPGEMGLQGILKEEAIAEFITKVDNHGNIWSGVKVDLNIVKKENFKGLRYSQYFMVMPGSPVLLHMVEVYNGSGKFLKDLSFENETFFKGDDDIRDSYFTYKDSKGKFRRLKPGLEDKEFTIKSSFGFSTKDRDHLVQTYSEIERSPFWGIGVGKEYLMGCMNDDINISDGSTTYLTPKFLIFNSEMIDEYALEDLKGIRF